MGVVTLIIILLLVAFLFQVDLIFYIVYVFAGIYAISRWYTPRSLRQLKLNREYNHRAFLGESVDIHLHMENKSRLPVIWAEFSESVPPEIRVGDPINQAVNLSGHQKRIFTYQVQAGQRGFYRIGPLRLVTSDLFGLTKGLMASWPEDYLTVYPKIVSLSSLGFPSRLPFGTIASKQRLFEDPARPAGVRDYHPGDSQRHINWKVSAHTDQLMVKRFQPAISLETAVLLNLNSTDYNRRERRYHTEWAIVTAASLAAHLVERRQAVGLICNGRDPLHGQDGDNDLEFSKESGRLLSKQSADDSDPLNIPPPILPRPGQAQLMKILEQLARIESRPTISFESWALKACLPLSWGVTILVITARGDEKTCQAIHRLVRSGFNPILIAVEADHNFGKVRERARLLGFRAYNVTQNRGMVLWRRSQRQGQR